MSASPVPQIFDDARHLAFQNRAAAEFESFSFLKQAQSSNLCVRLGDSARRFPSALDLGSHTGDLSLGLDSTDQVDHVVALEPSARMADMAERRGVTVHRVALDGLLDTFEPNVFDLVASALALHWVNDLPGVLLQIRSVLKPDGLFLGAYFGAGTLAELRQALMQAEMDILGGVTPRVSPLPGLQDSAALLQRAGFALPVADVDHVTVRYDSMLHLMADLRGMGEQAAFMAGGAPLSRRLLARAGEIYADQFSDPDGRIRASFEIIWLSGWAPAPHQPKPKRPGSATASLAAAVGAVEHSAGEPAGDGNQQASVKKTLPEPPSGS